MRLLWLALMARMMACGQDTTTFRADVSFVRVDAEVLTQDARIVRGLEKKDFRILDDGHEQDIAYLKNHWT